MKKGGVVLFLSVLTLVACNNVHITQAGFQNAMDTVIANNSTRSLSACIIKGNFGGTQEVFKVAANKAGRANPVTTDMYFGIASMTKTFVAATIFQLIGQGRLSLDQPVGTILYDTGLLSYAAYKDRIPYAITIRQLLSHTSGLSDYESNLGWMYLITAKPDRDRQWAHTEILDYLGKAGIPRYAYCNTNYVVLGLVIEQLTGQTVINPMHAYVLDPEGLSQTYMRIEEPARTPEAVGYEYIGGIYLTTATLIGTGTAYFSSIGTSANMASKCDDLARWAKIYYTYMNSRGYLEGSTYNNNDTYTGAYAYDGDMGLGIKRVTFRYHGGPTTTCLYGHTGSMLGFSGFFYYWPDKDISVAVLTNENQSDKWAILDAVIQYIRRVDTCI